MRPMYSQEYPWIRRPSCLTPEQAREQDERGYCELCQGPLAVGEGPYICDDCDALYADAE